MRYIMIVYMAMWFGYMQRRATKTTSEESRSQGL